MLVSGRVAIGELTVPACDHWDVIAMSEAGRCPVQVTKKEHDERVSNREVRAVCSSAARPVPVILCLEANNMVDVLMLSTAEESELRHLRATLLLRTLFARVGATPAGSGIKFHAFRGRCPRLFYASPAGIRCAAVFFRSL